MTTITKINGLTEHAFSHIATRMPSILPKKLAHILRCVSFVIFYFATQNKLQVEKKKNIRFKYTTSPREAIFKIRNGESGNGNGERGIFKTGNL